MKINALWAGALLGALAACGGGAAPSPPTSAAQSHVVGFKANALDAQTQAVKRIDAAGSCSSTTPIVLQADPQTTTPPASQQWWGGYNVAATEYDANCNVISTSATYTLSNASVTETSPAYFGVIPSPSPGTINVTGSTLGTATITATFPDSTTATLAVGIYGTAGVSCNQGYSVWDGLSSTNVAEAAWSASAGYPNAQADNENLVLDCNAGESFNPAPSPDIVDMEADATDGGIKFPYGYDVVSSNPLNEEGMPLPLMALQAIADCSSFTSQGTVLPQAQLADVGILEFKTSAGACVKFAMQFNGPDYSLVGYYAVSNSSGNFSY